MPDNRKNQDPNQKMPQGEEKGSTDIEREDRSRQVSNDNDVEKDLEVEDREEGDIEQGQPKGDVNQGQQKVGNTDRGNIDRDRK